MKKAALAYLLVITVSTSSAIAQRYSEMTEVNNLNAIKNFVIEGISLETSFSEMEELLTKNGWIVIQKTDNVSLLLSIGDYITKGSNYPVFSRNGSTAYTLKLNIVTYKDTKGMVLHLDRLPQEGMKDERGRRLPETGPIQSTYLDLKYGILLKELLCNGIVDEKKKWQSCPPNTKELVVLGQEKFHQGQQRVSVGISINADKGMVYLNYFEK